MPGYVLYVSLPLSLSLREACHVCAAVTVSAAHSKLSTAAYVTADVAPMEAGGKGCCQRTCRPIICPVKGQAVGFFCGQPHVLMD